MSGGNNYDRIFGGDGNDTLRGDAGRDVLIGEAGTDILWGGADSDRFVFKGAPVLSGQDTVMDFQDGVDFLVIEKLGIKQYSSSGAAGTVYAYDATGGDVLVKATTPPAKPSPFCWTIPTAPLAPRTFRAAISFSPDR